MKKMIIVVFMLSFVLTIFCSCGERINNTSGSKDFFLKEEAILDELPKVLEKGERFTITGIVDYSDEPSDIGENYCSITGDAKIEYLYTDIYDEESKWSSNVFYTKENDTTLLKKYVGQQVTVSGIFDAECHGIPYITKIDVLQ